MHFIYNISVKMPNFMWKIHALYIYIYIYTTDLFLSALEWVYNGTESASVQVKNVPP